MKILHSLSYGPRPLFHLNRPRLISMLAGLQFLVAAVAAPEPTYATVSEASVSVDVLDYQTMACRFTDRRGRPVVNQAVEVRSDSWLLGVPKTDGNGYVAWTSPALYGPSAFTFGLRRSSRWAPSSGSTTLIGILPVNLSVRVVAETVASKSTGTFSARLEMELFPAWEEHMADPLHFRNISVVISHPSASPVTFRLNTGPTGKIVARSRLPAAMLQGVVTVKANLPKAPAGYFRDVLVNDFARPTTISSKP